MSNTTDQSTEQSEQVPAETCNGNKNGYHDWVKANYSIEVFPPQGKFHPLAGVNRRGKLDIAKGTTYCRSCFIPFDNVK